MSTKFFNNSGENTLLNKFKGIFENNKDIEKFDALVGYFRSSGYFAIRPFLEEVPEIRILVGINVDNLISRYQAQGLLFQMDEQQTVSGFLQRTREDIQNCQYSKEVESGILQFIEDIVTKKIIVRAHPTRKLHAKLYIFRPKDFNEHKTGHVITGSSNLTVQGLGEGEGSNYEFNVLLNSYEDVVFASEEFESLWGESVAILPVEIKKLEKETYLSEEPTPFEVYIKFLIEYFGKSINFDPNSITDLPKEFMRLNYQIDAVSQGFELLMKHNGFFLADVVGLGKTVVATLIAKKFFYSNGFPSHMSHILIITPPAVRKNWADTFEKFGMNNYKIINNGSVHKIKNAEKYDLIIVDEAHKFRNDTPEAYNNLQILCKTLTRQTLGDNTKARKKVILVSATPLNNRPDDIRNQVYLFQDGRDSTLDLPNLHAFFTRMIDRYKQVKKEPDIKKMQAEVAKIYEEIRKKVIMPLTVRRTRTDLKENEAYWQDIVKQGIIFPEVEKPVKLFYQLDINMEALYDKTMELLVDEQKGLTYNRYRAISYLIPVKKKKYQSADLISSQLAKIMKILLVKRIDSSFYAFKQSLKRFDKANKAMIKMFEQGTIYIAPNLNVTEYIMEDREDELFNLILENQLTDPTIEICQPSDFMEGFKEGLYKDNDLLARLIKGWDKYDDDPKLEKFIFELRNGLLDRKINQEGKLVVFSESAETTEYLERNLKAEGFLKILAVTSKSRKELSERIRENFDANIPVTEQRNDCDILLSTEVMAEGINLHRANIIVNYDTPWNSTRLMQRIGRINRIGCTADKIYIYNFYPTAQVNSDIELEKKAIMKLQAFHSALGEDSQIYSPDEVVESFGLFDEVIEEERDERLAYLMELRKFKEKYPSKYRMIKKLPFRTRVGRNIEEKQDGSVCFIKNNRRDVFYLINGSNELEELSFVEAARIFRADTKEKSVSLHGRHHEQINLAVRDFNRKLESEAIDRQAVDLSKGPREKAVMSLLEVILKVDFLSDDEFLKIKAAKQAVKLAKFQKLVKELNKLCRAIKKMPIAPNVIVDSALKIIDKYPLDWENYEETTPLVTIRNYQEIKPEIIISESFDGKKE